MKTLEGVFSVYCISLTCFQAKNIFLWDDIHLLSGIFGFHKVIL